MPKFEVINNLADLQKSREILRFFCETRPGVVKKMGFEPVGDSAVGKTGWNTVEWLFDNAADRERFHNLHGDAVIIKGGPKNGS